MFFEKFGIDAVKSDNRVACDGISRVPDVDSVGEFCVATDLVGPDNFNRECWGCPTHIDDLVGDGQHSLAAEWVSRPDNFYTDLGIAWAILHLPDRHIGLTQIV